VQKGTGAANQLYLGDRWEQTLRVRARAAGPEACSGIGPHPSELGRLLPWFVLSLHISN
jgi:hypothetical protein